MPRPRKPKPAVVAEPPAVRDPEQPYPYDLPRYLHRAGETLFVRTVEECEAARRDGWVIHPKAAVN